MAPSLTQAADSPAWHDAVSPPRDVTLETRADPVALARLQAPGRVLFEDDFESDASFERYFEVRGREDGRVARDALARSGDGALRCTAPARAGESSGAGASAWLGDEGHARVYFRRYLRFADDYDQGHLNHTGGGLAGVSGANKWAGMGQAGVRPRGDDRFTCGFEPWRDWGRLASPGYMFLYTYWVDMLRGSDGNWWGNMLAPTPERRSVPLRGEWVCLEQMISVNTVGEADGELAAWIDGELYLHFKGLRWRTDEGVRIKRFDLGVYVHSAQRDNTVWYDDVVVSTGYVGPARDDKLRVLVWNIERGANRFTQGPEKALAVLLAARPDICLLQESYDIDGERPQLGAWLAGELGWSAWQGDSPHLCVLTPLQIEAQYAHAPWHGVGARLRDAAGRELDVYSTWIDWRAYLPYALRDDPAITDGALLACEREGSERIAQTTALLAHLQDTGRMTRAVPLLVGGDWNSPSHLDWTEDTARAFRFKRALPLPVSLACADAGFVDAFREVHPDPLRTPGFTWTPLERGTPEAPEPQDRIDRLLRLPSIGAWRLAPTAAWVLPQQHEAMDVPRAERVFPSDHGALVIDFRWVPGRGEGAGNPAPLDAARDD